MESRLGMFPAVLLVFGLVTIQIQTCNCREIVVAVKKNEYHQVQAMEARELRAFKDDDPPAGYNMKRRLPRYTLSAPKPNHPANQKGGYAPPPLIV